MGNVSDITFSPDSKSFVVQYTHKPGELWIMHDTPHGPINNITSVTFGQKSQHAIARYTNGQVYFLDMTWLDMITGHAETLPEAELIKLACTELLAQPRFDEKALQPYLGNQTPQACH